MEPTTRYKINRIKRQLIINKKLQFTVLLASVGLALLVSLPICLIQYLILNRPYLLIGPRLPYLIPAISMVTLVVALIFSFAMTNRIAGPIYRLKKHLDEINNGQKPVSEIQVRKDDYFQDLIESFNLFITKIKKP